MTNEFSTEQVITSILDKALDFASKGQVGLANKPLRAIYRFCIEFPYFFWDHERLLDVAKSFLIMYHFDTFDDEDSNIRIAHFAYFYAFRSRQQAITANEEDKLFESLKELVLIVDTCQDCFTESASQFYLPKNKEEYSEAEIIGSKLLANRVLPIVEYSFILEIEDRFSSFRDDEFIESACNKIEMDFESISEKLSGEGRNIGILVFNYISEKLKSGQSDF